LTTLIDDKPVSKTPNVVALSNGAIVPFFSNAGDMAKHMLECAKTGKVLHYIAQLALSPEQATVHPTPLFPMEALEAYTAKNLGDLVTLDQEKWFCEKRGGDQGDYSDLITEKILGVVSCLNDRPYSKRAYIVIPNNTAPDARVDADAKCMQLLNMMIEKSSSGILRLNASVTFRAQAVEIFPKNIHFIGALLRRICDELDATISPGDLLYHACILTTHRDG
jgi:hypothetical protein